MRAITPCLWFDGDAEEAAAFYAGIFPDSRVDAVTRSPADWPSGTAGQALTVGFTLMGQPYLGLNGGPGHPFTQAVSFSVPCRDQAEVDLYWDALLAGGGSPVACGWLRDRFGLSWQIVPDRLPAALASADRAAARRAMEAMMTMVKIDVAAIERAFAGEDGQAPAG